MKNHSEILLLSAISYRSQIKKFAVNLKTDAIFMAQLNALALSTMNASARRRDARVLIAHYWQMRRQHFPGIAHLNNDQIDHVLHFICE